MKTARWTTILLALTLALAGACNGSDDGSGIVGDGGGNGGSDASLDDTGSGGPGDGKLNGPCYANGTCDDGLECQGGFCIDPGGGPAEGEEGGPCYANDTCDTGLECEDGTCVRPDTTGQDGGPCFGNGTCNEGLVCVDDVCREPGEEGTEGGPCRAEDPVCDAGLVCRGGFCQEPVAGEYAWENPCTDLVADPRMDGVTCTDHCQCESGYCYDEGYLHPFRFCTRRCDGAENRCRVENDMEVDVCLQFSGTTWVDELEPPVHLRHFCVPGCTSDNDCDALDPAWSSCTSSTTTWAGHTIAARRTCIVNN